MTRYTPYQREECSEQYKKVCHLRRDKVQLEEMVEVCRTALQRNCSLAGSGEGEECRTMYESECWTKYEHHEVRTFLHDVYRLSPSQKSLYLVGFHISSQDGFAKIS